MLKKVDPTVIKETLIIAVGTLILSVLMQAVFLVTGFWDITVLWGNLLSWAAGVLNFFLLGLTVSKALEKDSKKASNMIRLSQFARLIFMLGIGLLGALLPCFNIWATLIPLVFPRIVIFIRGIFDKKFSKKGGAEVTYGEEDKN